MKAGARHGPALGGDALRFQALQGLFQATRLERDVVQRARSAGLACRGRSASVPTGKMYDRLIAEIEPVAGRARRRPLALPQPQNFLIEFAGCLET